MAGFFDDLIPAQGGTKDLMASDRQFLNEQRTMGEAATDTLDQIRRAEMAARRFNPSPFKAALYDAALPQESGGFLDKLGAALLGGPARWTGAVTQRGIDDFQALKGLQSGLVLTEQLQQKGPQTESDAARLQMTQMSPYKSLAANLNVAGPAAVKAALGIQKAPFYTKWVNKYGLNGLDEHGQSVDDAWFALKGRARSMEAQRRPATLPKASGKAPADMTDDELMRAINGR